MRASPSASMPTGRDSRGALGTEQEAGSAESRSATCFRTCSQRLCERDLFVIVHVRSVCQEIDIGQGSVET